jgi:stearoyl-CoA desaturase (delta-9 desaturase)
MHFGSSRRNLTALTIFFIVTAISGFFYFDFSLQNLLISLACFYLLNIGGVYMTLHRYYSHKNFEFRHGMLQAFFTGIALLAGRGSVLGWVYVHRKHHRFSDSALDPHPPKFLGFKMFGFDHFKKIEEESMQIFLVKDIMTPPQLFVHKYYLLMIAAVIAALMMYSTELLYFVYILPCFAVHVSQVLFNYFGHTHGYRNFETKDHSQNNAWLFPLILGESWHNNHHSNPGTTTTKVKWYEFDPLNFLISAVKK